MDNQGIARVLREIADLLEIKGDNPFKIRAYRNGGDIVANHPHDLAALDSGGLREIPGIGKDLAARIVEIAASGDCTYHRELVAEFPPSVLEMLRLQGVGPKTVATLYRELNVRTLDELELACTSGRVRAIKGMGAKKESLILKALTERKQYAGRHLLPEADKTATAVVAYLQQQAPAAQLAVVGSLRRGCETCGDIDILATGADGSLLETFTLYPRVDSVLGHGETKASALLHGGFQVDVRLVPPESRGAALQYFTGSKAHNIALRDRAIGLGLKLNEYGVFRTAPGGEETGEAGGERLAGSTEEEVYAALGLPWIPPELRENRGELDAALAGRLPSLIERAQLRGDLHMHSTATDGRDTIEGMAEAAAAAGLEYIAITDHSQALAMANGLDEARALAHAARIRSIDGHAGVRLLAGIECDIRADGTLDLDDECLAALDIVIVSVHSAFGLDRQQMTDRLIRAIEHPHVDIVGHPSGRLLLRREALPFDLDAVLTAAAKHGVAMEINCQVDRLDLNDVQARLARDRGVPLVISSDAHSTGGFARLRWGALVARRAWLQPEHVLNTRAFDQFKAGLRRNRAS